MQKCGARRRGYSRGKQPSVTHELRRPHRRSRATSRGGCSPALTRRTGHVARCPPKRHCGDGPIGSADRPSWSRATTTFCRQRGRHFRLRALMRSARPQVRRCSVRPSPAVLAAPNGSPRLPHVAGSISLVRPRRTARVGEREASSPHGWRSRSFGVDRACVQNGRKRVRAMLTAVYVANTVDRWRTAAPAAHAQPLLTGDRRGAGATRRRPQAIWAPD